MTPFSSRAGGKELWNSMTPRLSMKAIVPLLGAAALLTLAGSASAAPCAGLPKPVYITGSTAVKPFMAGLGKALNGQTTLVYKGQGSCVGVDAILNGTPITGTASYWDAMGMEQTCDLAVPAGDAVDVGVSDVFATTCPGGAMLPATVGEFFRPYQVMGIVVPVALS